MRRFLLLISMIVFIMEATAQKDFVVRKNGLLLLNNTPYRYIGTNYWYGSYLALQPDAARGIDRLRNELDFLKARGITNLRVIGGAEGTGKILGNYRVGPPLQPAKGVFDTAVLYGLDVLLDEMAKRNMKAVIFFSNNWEWSGGFLQYLNWNGLLSDSALHAKMEWEEMCDQVSKFYSCEPCTSGYLQQVDVIMDRINTVNGKKYVDDATIMSWELANEPRPMRPSAEIAYGNWIRSVAAHIKQKDPYHLVCIGHEGYIATQPLVYDAIHADDNIDYLTIHIWPKNWGWTTNTTLKDDVRKVDSLTKDYIRKHLALSATLKKPLVIEEFGYPRDEMKFTPATNTSLRDHYYRTVLSFLAPQHKQLAGINFWAFNGTARPKQGQLFWKPGDDYMGDPPMEEQSLYGIYNSDTTTWKVIATYIKQYLNLTNHR